MAAAPHHQPREGNLDAGWEGEASDAQPRSGRSPCPVRSGTRDWGDDLDAAVDAHRARLRAVLTRQAPARGGTRDWEELLPPAVLARYRAAAAARARGSAVRGGTRDWDELTRLVNLEIAAARAGTSAIDDPLDALAVGDLAALLLGELDQPAAPPAALAAPEATLDDAPSIVVHGEEPWDGDDEQG
ncbi:MAG: hypothetical protein WKG00_34705 [Polyangiaceae bacterium]